MKLIFIVSVFTIVGACSHKRYSEKLQDIKNNVKYEKIDKIEKFSNTINAAELKDIVYEITSEAHGGRLTGSKGHARTCEFIKDFYSSNGISSPLLNGDYFQHIPKSSLSDRFENSQNVIAYIKGTAFPNEVLVISAHSDHLGDLDGTLYPGADDNGSGTSAVLEIAEAFKLAQNEGFSPKRSILFLHLTGEEQGLYGSSFYIKHPAFPLQNTVANLNIDMIGRVDRKHEENPNYIYLIGSDRISTELHYISETANDKFTKLDIDYTYNAEDDSNRYYYRSDHYNFAQNGVPVIFYFNGEHDDYHKPTDTADKIQYKLLEKRARLIFATAWYIANSDKRLAAIKI